MAGTTHFTTANAAVATAEFTGAVVLEADLELTASGSIGCGSGLSGDAGTESLTIVDVTDLTFAAAVGISPDRTNRRHNYVRVDAGRHRNSRPDGHDHSLRRGPDRPRRTDGGRHDRLLRRALRHWPAPSLPEP
ncbi:MAG: hypothetical protein R3C12_19320 [Planctomycetaceae bacterium]